MIEKKDNYESPAIEIIAVETEQTFATSFGVQEMNYSEEEW